MLFSYNLSQTLLQLPTCVPSLPYSVGSNHYAKKVLIFSYFCTHSAESSMYTDDVSAARDVNLLRYGATDVGS